MRIARPAFLQVQAYAEARGCTVFDESGHRFLAPDRSRAIRVREVQPGVIYLFDTSAGIVRLERHPRRSDRITPRGTEQGDTSARGKANALPLGAGLQAVNLERGNDAPDGQQMTLSL